MSLDDKTEIAIDVGAEDVQERHIEDGLMTVVR